MSDKMDKKVEVVAELSGNHNGSKDRLLDLTKLAKDSGATMVKVQCFRPDTITADSNHSSFQINDGPWAGSSLYELYSLTYLPWEWYDDLFLLGKNLDIEIFASVFDEKSADFISQYNPVRVKIASPEIIDSKLIEYCAHKFQELIISTGMASKLEIENAVRIVRSFQKPVTLLQCVSEYPAKASSYNLKGISYLASIADAVGISDHSIDDTVVLGSVALGAKFVEKHFTDSRSNGGIDSHFSLEPKEFLEMSKKISALEAACKIDEYTDHNLDCINKKYRRSLFFSTDLKSGHKITASDIKCIRPGSGLHPSMISQILGKNINCDVVKNHPIKLRFFSDK
jgi:sialic acid synthase SpsE